MLISTAIHESIFVIAAARELIHAIGAIPWIEFASALPLTNAVSGLQGSREPQADGLRPHGLEIVQTDTANLVLDEAPKLMTEYR